MGSRAVQQQLDDAAGPRGKLHRAHIDQLIDLYFDGHCPPAIRAKIYGYVATCGLLWSNWCEHKRLLGVGFGEYGLCQYRYARKYGTIAHDGITKIAIPKEDV